MKIEVDKKYFFTIAGAILLIVGIVGVLAYTKSIPDPGHGGNSVLISINDQEKTIQQAIDDGDFGGGGGSYFETFEILPKDGSVQITMNSGVSKVLFKAWGGGAGGHGGDCSGTRYGSAGGGAAAYVEKTELDVAGNIYTIRAGAGGTGGGSCQNRCGFGSNGGSSIITGPGGNIIAGGGKSPVGANTGGLGGVFGAEKDFYINGGDGGGATSAKRGPGGAGGVRTGSKGIGLSKSHWIDDYGYGGAGGPNSLGCSGVRGGDGLVRVVIFYS